MAGYSSEDWDSLGGLAFTSYWSRHVVRLSREAKTYPYLKDLAKSSAINLVLLLADKSPIRTQLIWDADRTLTAFADALHNRCLEEMPALLLSDIDDVAKLAKWRLERGV